MLLPVARRAMMSNLRCSSRRGWRPNFVKTTRRQSNEQTAAQPWISPEQRQRAGVAIVGITTAPAADEGGGRAVLLEQLAEPPPAHRVAGTHAFQLFRRQVVQVVRDVGLMPAVDHRAHRVADNERVQVLLVQDAVDIVLDELHGALRRGAKPVEEMRDRRRLPPVDLGGSLKSQSSETKRNIITSRSVGL